MFVNGWTRSDNFSDELTAIALAQSGTSSDKVNVWPANWVLGLTGKGVQNILRGNPDYIRDFEAAVTEAADQCEVDFGPSQMYLEFSQNGKTVSKLLSWKDIARLTTAVGCATMTIRGSDKSLYGKLFERLVLGSALTLLGFKYVETPSSHEIERVFWLSDSTDARECDATIRLQAGKLVRFDLGFIGKGNPEIMLDKLTRYAREVEHNGMKATSQSFVIVDQTPSKNAKGKQERFLRLLEQSQSEVIQMSMQVWPLLLAERLKTRLGYDCELLHLSQDEALDYFSEKMMGIPILNFLRGVDISKLEVTDDTASPDESDGLLEP